MAEQYKIDLGVQLNQADFGKIKTDLNNLHQQKKINLDFNMKSINHQINSIKKQIQDLSDTKINLGGVVADTQKATQAIKNISNISGNNNYSSGIVSGVKNDVKAIKTAISDAEDYVRKLKTTLHGLDFNDESIDVVTKDLKEMNLEINNVTAKLKKTKNGNFLDVSVKGIDELERTVTVIKQFEYNSGQITDVGKTIAQSFDTSVDAAKRFQKEVNAAFSELTKKQDKIGKLELELEGLDPEKNARRINNIKSQISDLKSEYNELLAVFGTHFDNGQWNKIEKDAVETANKISLLQDKLADTTAANKQTKAFKELLSVSKEISNLKTNIADLKLRGGNNNLITELENELKSLQVTYKQLVSTMDAPLGNDQWGAINNQIIKTKEEIAKLEAKYKDVQAEISKGIQLKVSDSGSYTQTVDKLNTKFDGLSNASNESRIAINQLNQALKDMRNASTDDDRIEAEKRFQKALQDSNYWIEKNIQAQKQSVADIKLSDDIKLFQGDIDAYLAKNSAAVSEFGDRFNELRIAAENCDRVTLDHLKKEVKSTKQEVKAAGLETKTFGDALKDQFAKFSNYFTIATLFMYAEQGLRDMFEQVKLIDSAMTELKKVTDETDATYNQFLGNAAERAKKIGTTIDGLVDSTAEFAKIGYSFEESQGLAEVANVYKLVGDNIESAEVATKSLISTMAAFKGEMGNMSDTDFAMSIVDKFNEVANAYSIGSGGLGEALQRSASSLAAGNNTLDESLALITAANEVVQDEARVGNAMKTISMRIRGAKTQLEEAGESTDGMAESTAKLREEIMALSGVDIMLNADTFKSTYQIMEELSYKWADLSDIAQASITELLAGGTCLPEYVEIHI